MVLDWVSMLVRGVGDAGVSIHAEQGGRQGAVGCVAICGGNSGDSGNSGSGGSGGDARYRNREVKCQTCDNVFHPLPKLASLLQ